MEINNEIKTIRDTIPPKKYAKRYRMHRYFTRRPFNVVQAYIKNYTKEGDIVLDPFCGTGVTAVESLILRRKAIAVDICPLSTFITKMIAISPIDLKKFQNEFIKIKEKISPEIIDLYRKKDEEIEKMNFKYWYPKNVRLPKNADVKTVDELFTKRNLLALSILLNEIKQVKDKKISNMLLFTFSATLPAASKLTRATGGGPMPINRYWVPDKFVEHNVWDAFEKRYEIVKEGKQETNDLINGFYKKNNTFFCYTQSAIDLSNISSNSVDYIFTDPPYGANIAYLDLSIMWDAWLGFKVSEKDFEEEIIEGGDLNKTQEDYVQLLKKSFKEMFRVLKDGRWLSIIFHHKELKLWNAVVNGCKDLGFEYVNTVTQPTKMQSFHKATSPLTTMAGELIINFKKSKKITEKKVIVGSSIKNIILNTAERLIVQNDGATTDDIYHIIIPELLEANLIDVAVKEVNDVTPILREEYKLDENNKWQLTKGTKIGTWIPLKNRMRFYIISFLRREKEASIDEIRLILLPLLANGKQPENKEILEILKEVAKPKGNKWKLDEKHIKEKQKTLLAHTRELPYIKFDKEDSKENHNETIYALVNLAKDIGYKVWIGKKEQGQTYNKIKLYNLCDYDELPLMDIKKNSEKIIEQIDIIWFEKHKPVAAFEIENTTNVQRGMVRFANLIKNEPQISSELYILAPNIREKKVIKEMNNPMFIGHPHYFEKKVKYILYSDFIKLYQSLLENHSLKPSLKMIKRISKFELL